MGQTTLPFLAKGASGRTASETEPCNVRVLCKLLLQVASSSLADLCRTLAKKVLMSNTIAVRALCLSRCYRLYAMVAHGIARYCAIYACLQPGRVRIHSRAHSNADRARAMRCHQYESDSDGILDLKTASHHFQPASAAA